MDEVPRTSPEELRQVAEYVENRLLDTLATYSDIAFPLVRGDLRTFPRPSAESRAAERGFDVLRQDTDAAVSVLHALAAALENDLEVPPVFLVPVLPYIDAFRSAADVDANDNESQS
jgi:hypothetical protein